MNWSAIRESCALDFSEFSAAIFGLEPVEKNMPTCGTDGARLFYNPKYLQTLSYAEQCGELLHEVAHVIFLDCIIDPADGRNKKKLNLAADIHNDLLLDRAGVKLTPISPVHNEQVRAKYTGLTREEIYDLLPEDAHSRCELQFSPGEPSAEAKQILAEFCSRAARRGWLTADSAESLRSRLQDRRATWVEQLRASFAEIAGRDDYGYRRPSKRGLWRGEILRSLSTSSELRVAFCQDTSGSMSAEDCARDVAEIRSAMAQYRISGAYIQCDSAVQAVRFFDPSTVLTVPEIAGRGGTDFAPALKLAIRYDVDVIVYFTDLDGPFPPAALRKPIFWLTRGGKIAPIGKTIVLK